MTKINEARFMFGSGLLFPLLLTGLFAGIYGALVWASSTVLFAYADIEFYNLLFSDPEFTQKIFAGSDLVSWPWQHLSPLMWAGLTVARYLGAMNLAAAWVAQTVLAGVFFFRVTRLANMSGEANHWLMYLVLLSCHPMTWIILLTDPSLILSLVLLVEFLLIKKANEDREIRLFVTGMLLSLSGLLGFVAALVITLYFLAVSLMVKREISQRIVVLCASILPALFVFAALSYSSGILGGARLAGEETVLSNLSVATFINGVWTDSIRTLFLWVGNGLMVLPVALPLFGFLALAGMALALLRGKMFGFRGPALCLICVMIFLLGFLPEEKARLYVFFIYPFLLVFVLDGLKELSGYFKKRAEWVSLVVVSGGAFLMLFQFPAQWKEPLQRAVFYENIFYNLESNIQAERLPRDESLYLRFHPAVYASLPDDWTIELFGFKLIDALGVSADGANVWQWGLPVKEMPEFILDYADFQTVKAGGPKVQPRVNHLAGYFEHYESTRLQNLFVYEKRRETLTDGEFTFLNSETIGTQWYFENGFGESEQTGVAFGLGPTLNHSVVGTASAGPVADKASPRLGVLQSEPFVIEGDDLHVVANLPRASTKSIICLAVYDDVAYGPGERVKQARHIYDYQPAESLMEDTFYYIEPANLLYLPGRIRGWRVVHYAQGGKTSGWQHWKWALDPWKNKQALWHIADRDSEHALWVDQITQHIRPPGYYWNFEKGDYAGWDVSGNAFGTRPTTGELGDQSRVKGVEGNYFVNSYSGGSDVGMGVLSTPDFPLELNRMSFLIGGGDDDNAVYLALIVNGQITKLATGQRDETLRRVVWDLSPWKGQQGRIEIVDQSSSAWGHILVDDIRLYDVVK